MSDPIKVEVPKNASEARELAGKLAAHESELNSYMDDHDPASGGEWNSETQSHFDQAHADEKAMVAALESYQDNVKAAAEARSKIEGASERFSHLSKIENGGSSKRRKAQEIEDEFGDQVLSLEDHEIVDQAVVGHIMQHLKYDLTDEQEAAVQANRKNVLDCIRDPEMRRQKGYLFDTASDDVVQAMQYGVKNGRDIRGDLTTINPASATSGSGSQLFNTSFITRLEAARLAFGGMAQVSDIMTTSSGELIVWPTIDDTANVGESIAEAGGPQTVVDPSFGEVTWSAYKYGSTQIKVTRELIEDNQVGLVGRVADMLGTRLARLENQLFTSGTGVAQPTGLMTVCPTAFNAASNAGILFDEIIDLEHSIDPARRISSARYMFTDNTLALLRKLKDAESRYLWQSGANTGAPSSLNGYGYTINQDMNSFNGAAGQKPIVFGDLSMFKIRRVRGMRLVITDELHSQTDEIAFFAWIRIDSNLLDAGDNPVQCIETV